MDERVAAVSARGPFRADHVGSFLRPAALRTAMEQAAAGAPPPDLAAIQDAAIRAVVALQENVGLAVVTDGEFRRTSFHNFLEQIEGATVNQRTGAARGLNTAFEPRSYAITGKLRHVRPIEVPGFAFLKSITDRVPKVTMASPTMLLRASREQISREAYPELDAFYADVAALYRAEIAALAAAGCSYVQLDDTNFAYLCDPNLRARRQLGEGSVDDIAKRYARLINGAIAERPAGMAACIHICRGNAAGSFAAQGGYDPIAEVLLNEIEVDGYLLEYDDARSGGFEPLRFFPKGSAKKVVLGLVTSKSPELESKDLLMRRIEEASRFVPLENLCLSPQCGFASTYKGNPLTEDAERRKLALIVETATEIWGGVV
jgi:5-methyltetrahydropteroyltriglutamate--homocysteine methyltransferase